MNVERLLLLTCWPFGPIVFICLGITRIQYVIDDRYVRVKLFGMTLRKIALTDIEFADTKCPLWNEHWCNTFFAWGRSVRLRRKTGFARNFIITPTNRAAFLDELHRKLGR